MADYENSNKALDKARLKGKDVPQAEEHQQHCLQKFDKLSESGKKGLLSSSVTRNLFITLDKKYLNYFSLKN